MIVWNLSYQDGDAEGNLRLKKWFYGLRTSSSYFYYHVASENGQETESGT